jgi:hypothetical protein
MDQLFVGRECAGISERRRLVHDDPEISRNGSPTRSVETVIGDSTNLNFRLEGLAGRHGLAGVLVTAAVHDAVEAQFIWGAAEQVETQGRQGIETVFRVPARRTTSALGPDSPEPLPGQAAPASCTARDPRAEVRSAHAEEPARDAPLLKDRRRQQRSIPRWRHRGRCGEQGQRHSGRAGDQR